MKEGTKKAFWRRYLKVLKTEQRGDFSLKEIVGSSLLCILGGIVALALMFLKEGRVCIEYITYVMFFICSLIALVFGINELTVMVKYFRRNKEGKAPSYVKLILCLLVPIMVIISILTWAVGRKIIMWMGYAICVFCGIGYFFIGANEISKLYLHYKKLKKMDEAGTLEDEFTVWPYEVEPYEAPVPSPVYFFARDALMELADPVYSGYLEYQAGKEKLDNKYLYVNEKDQVATFSCEISALKLSEAETFPGYATFISRNFDVVTIDEENLSHAEMKCKMGNYIRDYVKPDYECYLVTNDYEFKILARSRELQVLSVQELKNRWKGIEPAAKQELSEDNSLKEE